MKVFENLQPSLVWQCFEEICQVPRPSKKEEKIIAYLVDFAKKHNLEYKTDDAGNVLIKKPATPGFENRRTVVLQSHMDMVCEKNNDTVHDFEKDPIQPYIDGDWIKAKGTTLGADDGIGMAAALAVLISTDLQHGPVECLFTVDEETGLTGAFALKPGFFEGTMLINLDSEDEGELFIGCAGGMDTVITMKYKPKEANPNHVALKVSVSGLTGGHSGDDINKGYANSNKILNRFLWFINEELGIRLADFNGGNLRNAIPREAFAVFTINDYKVEMLQEMFSSFEKEMKAEYAITEPNMKMAIEETSLPEFVMNKTSQYLLLDSLYACPHGVISMSQAMPGLVETSTNLASVKFDGKKSITITTSQRSSVESAKHDIVNMVETVFLLANADVEHSDGYPGWNPNPNSDVLRITRASYEKLFGKTPVVRAIHAGLECGLFTEKYPGLDMISVGPTLRGVHSPDERLEIPSVKKFWDLLVEVLQQIPEK